MEPSFTKSLRLSYYFQDLESNLFRIKTLAGTAFLGGYALRAIYLLPLIGLSRSVKRSLAGVMDMERCAQQARWKQYRFSHQGEDTVNGNSYDAEWKQQEPHDRIKDKGEERERPAENK